MANKTTLLLATTNQGKVKEIVPHVQRHGISIISLADVGEDPSFVEEGESFAENAIAKAMHYNKLHGIPTIADDSGLCVNALDGAPGVKSSRFMGEETPYTEKMQAIIGKLSGKTGEEREANFACSLAFVHSEKVICTITKRVFGFIAETPKGENGFGYDPIFYCPELRATFGETEDIAKHRVSHRGKAVLSFSQLLDTHQEVRKLLKLD